MTESFINSFYNRTSGSMAWTDMYTAPSSAGNVSLLLGLQISNTGGSAAATIETGARIYDISSGSGFSLIENAQVPIRTALNPVSGKVVLDAGDKLQINMPTTGSAAFIGSFLEIT